MAGECPLGLVVFTLGMTTVLVTKVVRRWVKIIMRVWNMLSRIIGIVRGRTMARMAVPAQRHNAFIDELGHWMTMTD